MLNYPVKKTLLTNEGRLGLGRLQFEIPPLPFIGFSFTIYAFNKYNRFLKQDSQPIQKIMFYPP